MRNPSAASSRPRRPATKRHREIWAKRRERPRPDPIGGAKAPPRCPNEACGNHCKPEGKWFIRGGQYWPLCRARPLKRYRCKACGRSFSCQTFRMDWWDKKPWLNPRVLEDLGSGLGLRMTARRVGIARSSMTAKSRKMARHCRALHRNMLRRVDFGNVFTMDEGITFEQDRGTNHVGLAVLIDFRSYLVLGARSEALPPQGRQSKARKERIRKREEKEGKRRDQTRRSVIAVLLSMAEALRHRKEPPRAIEIRSDKKRTYPGCIKLIMKRRLPGIRVKHSVYKGDGYKRDWQNPLFRINHTLARIRDRFSRLRRSSWLVSKRRCYLNQQVMLFICVRNYVEPWKNGREESPAQRAGVLPRRLSWHECLGWRQDWGVERSPWVLARNW